MAPPARNAPHSQQECAYGSMSVPVAVHGALGGARASIGACGWRDRAYTQVVHRCAQAGLSRQGWHRRQLSSAGGGTCDFGDKLLDWDLVLSQI